MPVLTAIPAKFDPVFPRSRLVTIATALPLAVLPALIVLFIVHRSWSHADLTLVGGIGLLIGLPHGAIDLYLELGPGGVPRGRALIVQLVTYLVAIGAVLTCILSVPVLGIGVFLAISAWHFGSGDAAFNACRHGLLPRLAVVETIAYGAPLTVVALVRWPARIAEVVDPLAGPGVTATLVPPALIAVGVAGAGAIVTAVRKATRGHWLDVAELVLLWASVVLLPPMVAFAVYFALWHSPRHVIRTLPELPANRPDLSGGRMVWCLLRYLGYALPGTIAALAVFAVLILFRDNGAALAGLRPTTLTGAVLAALTVPHAVTILRYDLWLNKSGDADR